MVNNIFQEVVQDRRTLPAWTFRVVLCVCGNVSYHARRKIIQIVLLQTNNLWNYDVSRLVL